jgi:hypothetical protein
MMGVWVVYESSCRILTNREWYAVMQLALACLSGDAHNDSRTQGRVHVFYFRGAQVGQLPSSSE